MVECARELDWDCRPRSVQRAGEGSGRGQSGERAGELAKAGWLSSACVRESSESGQMCDGADQDRP